MRHDENGRVPGLQYIHPPSIFSVTSSDMPNDNHSVTRLTEEQVEALPALVCVQALVTLQLVPLLKESPNVYR